MSLKIMLLAAVGLPLIVVGCATPPAPTGKFAPISVTVFVNSLKCEYAKYVMAYKPKHIDVRNWPVSGSMALNIVVAESQSGSAAVAGLVPFQGVKVGFGFSSSVDRKRTTLTTLKFQLRPGVSDASVCEAAKTLLVDGGLGFGDWLFSLSRDLDRAAEGTPKFGVSALNYQLIFAVEQGTKGDGSLTVVPLTLSASALASRNDVQTITIDLQPPTVVVGHDAKGSPIKKPIIKEFFQPVVPNAALNPMLVPQ